MHSKAGAFPQLASCDWLSLAWAFAPTPADTRAAIALCAEYLERGYLERTCAEMLALPDAVIAGFYAQLAEHRSHLSPVRHRTDSSWMRESDFCFVNVRATGRDEAFGNLISVCKLFPLIRANALHLGPFTLYDHGVIYAVTSVRTISPKVVHPELAAAGWSDEDQLRALVQAAHLLGKTVGFDLEPHMSQFALPVIEHPRFFRWIRVDPGQGRLAIGTMADNAGSETVQAAIAAEVDMLRRAEFERAGIATLESEAGDSAQAAERKAQAFATLVRQLIERGIWPLLCQAWDCVGLPAFERMHPDGYPKFYYRAADGSNASDHAYPILTPVKFHRDLPVNRAPAAVPEPDTEAIAWFAGIFSHWRDRFGFDFVRYDSVDHVFDSVQNGDPAHAASDRPTPAVLATTIAASRTAAKPWIGNLAERMGNEIDEYADIGFDLLLGDDMMWRIDRSLIEKSFAIHDRLLARDAAGRPASAICFAIDTHDTGNGGLWGDSLIRLMGPERLRLRHFVARFLGCGAARRPKYEVVGLSDLSHGLYPANISDANLHWVGDRDFLRHYHALEDLYARLAPALAAGRMIARHADNEAAWWIIETPQGCLVPLVSLEKADDHPLAYRRIEHPALHGMLAEFDCGTGIRHEWGRINGRIEAWDLPNLKFRLFATGFDAL